MASAKFLIIVIISLGSIRASSQLDANYYPGRGGCTCDCSWANTSACGKDDNTCCFASCCNSSAPAQKTYCPSANDFFASSHATQNIVLFNGGWSIHGPGGVGTKAAFNLIGGSAEWDIDFSKTNIGVNGNIYTISPAGIPSTGYTASNYCDGSKPAGSDYCAEVDWIESNGNCGGQSTLHDVPGPGENGCTAWGCALSYHYNGQSSFHMKVTYDSNGVWTTTRNGQVISPSNLSPKPSSSDWSTLYH